VQSILQHAPHIVDVSCSFICAIYACLFSWKVWSTERFVVTWGEFLRRPDAAQDAQYGTIKEMYAVATGAQKKKK
jgi:hypothetical protein